MRSDLTLPPNKRTMGTNLGVQAGLMSFHGARQFGNTPPCLRNERVSPLMRGGTMSEKQVTEINDVAPSALSHLIGQKNVVEQVRVALDAAHQDGKKFDHALLVGPSG